MVDCVFPIVFPDYLISLEHSGISIDLPDVLPWDDKIEDMVNVPPGKFRVPDLGHAGVLFIGKRGKKGITKYYEYGRFGSSIGLVRRRPMPDCIFSESGELSSDSLLKVFLHISRVAGQGGRIDSAYIQTPGKYQNMLAYAMQRVEANSNPDRRPYDVFTHSCIHFVMQVVKAGGVDYEPGFVGGLADARPISYINIMRDLYLDATYSARSGRLSIGD